MFKRSRMVEPTKEQRAIVAAPECDLTLIQAYAGSGKTTTLRLIAESKPRTKKILYVCFGKENQRETERRFAHLPNVKATTFDGLTYRLFDETRHPAGLNKWVISRELHIDTKEADTVADQLKNYMESPAARKTTRQAAAMWKRLVSGQSEYTNFAYLRKRFLNRVMDEGGWTEDFELLLVDECQDLNPVMLEALLKFRGPKVFVGDRYQHIFSFMGTVDTFERLEGEPNIVRWTLSQSFRFGEHIADLASKMANSMFYKPPSEPVRVIGTKERGSGTVSYYPAGRSDKFPTQTPVAILAVKNQTLLKLAFDAAEEGKKIHMIGRDQFFSLLEHEYQEYIKNGAASTERKRNAAEWNEDSEMASICSTILSYGSYLPDKIAQVKQMHVPLDRADYILCTLHKSKGLEFDTVKLLDDLEVGKRGREKNATQLLESMDEKNRLYYVGVTRAKKHVLFPETIVKECFQSSSSFTNHTEISPMDGRLRFLSATKTIDIS